MNTLKISQTEIESSNNCGGFKTPQKGKHLDTQMFPECEGTETDRNLLQHRNKKEKKNKKAENKQNELKIVALNGKYSVKLSKQEYLSIGIKNGWIKQANLIDALSDLNKMIENGIEFPIAEWEVTKKYKLSENEVKDLKNDYDKGQKEQLEKENYDRDQKNKSENYVEAKNKKDYEHSPTSHGFIDECIKKNEDKKDSGAYCASIVDKAKGTTEWRKELKKKD